jgi:hypothetical protein
MLEAVRVLCRERVIHDECVVAVRFHEVLRPVYAADVCDARSNAQSWFDSTRNAQIESYAISGWLGKHGHVHMLVRIEEIRARPASEVVELCAEQILVSSNALVRDR